MGYAKPPKETRFTKGRSGNPKGRPKGARSLAADLRDELAERITLPENGKRRTLTKQQALVKRLVSDGLKGNHRAAAKLLDLAHGLGDDGDGRAKPLAALLVEDEEILRDVARWLAKEAGDD